MRKILTIGAIATLSMGLAACGGNEPAEEAAPMAEEAAPAAEEAAPAEPTAAGGEAAAPADAAAAPAAEGDTAMPAKDDGSDDEQSSSGVRP